MMKYLLTILIIIGLCSCSISPVMAAEESDEQYAEIHIEPTIWLNSKVVVKPTNGEGPVIERHTHRLMDIRMLLPKSIDEWTVEYYSGAPWKKARNLKLTSYGQIKLSDYPKECRFEMQCWRHEICINVLRGDWQDVVDRVVLTDVKK